MAIPSKLAEVMNWSLRSGAHEPAQICEIELSNGGVTKVDKSDLPLLSRHVWHRDTQGYARAMIKVNRWKLVRMHRFLMQPPDGQFVDHIDCNPLNNSRANLRVCTPAQSIANIRKYTGKSRFKGVCWHAAAKKWMAQIKDHGRYRYLGLFTSEEDAATAYARAAIEIHGEFARVS